MEMIKSIVNQFYPLLIMLACVSFVIYVFFSVEFNGGEGVFEATGNIYAPMIGTDEVKNDGLDYVSGSVTGGVPVVKYISGAKQAGTNFVFKDVLEVHKAGGSIVSATTEDDFAIYLADIKTQSGESVLQFLSKEEIENLEEIPAAFIYDKETDLLYLYSSGIYTVEVKIYGNNGGQEVYEFKLPVETM